MMAAGTRLTLSARFLLMAFTVAIGFAALQAAPASAQITPPKPGVELPSNYLERLAHDRGAFQFKRAWKAQTQRVRLNRYLLETGLAPGVLGVDATAGVRVEGTRYVPVLAGKFSNTGSDPYSDTALQNQLFDGPNPTGTMTDYYDEISYGYIDLQGNVYGDQAGGLFQVAHPDTFYEGDLGENGLPGGNAKTGEYLQELLDGADGWVDFSQFDNDGPDGIPNSGDDDGYVDFVAFVHPEFGGECGSSNIWSHRWVYEGWWGSPYITNDAAAGGGFIQVSDYTIQPLLSCDRTNIIEIGVFAHEFGHAFGLPDLYDTDGSSNGVGEWCLMASGSWGGDGAHPEQPSHMSAWCKEQLGWVDPIVACGNQPGATLSDVETSGEVLKVYPHGISNDEYFLVENRIQTGFDVHIHTNGIAVWHIDNGQTSNRDDTHRLVDLEEADGLGHLDSKANRGDDGDLFPGSSNNQLFDDTTNPNALDYAGTPTGFSLANFGFSANPRSFDVTSTRVGVADVAVDDSDWGNNSGSLDENERGSLLVGLRNDHCSDETGVSATLVSLDPLVTVLQDSVYYGTVNDLSINYGTSSFEIQAGSPIPGGTTVSFRVDVTGNGGYASSGYVSITVGSYILIVEDDNVANVTSTYTAAVAAAGYDYVVHDTGAQGLPALGQLNAALAVVWYTGDAASGTFSATEQALIGAYLDGGGALFVTGQDVGYDLVETGDALDETFYEDYLHANYVSDTSADETLSGVSGDPIGDGINLTLNYLPGDNTFWPSVISGRSGTSDVFRYSSSKDAAIRYSTGHKLVYFAFNYEDIIGTTIQATVMERVLDWLMPADLVAPTATLLAPVGGEYFESCLSRVITWTAADNVAVDEVDLYYSDDGGVSYPHTIATGLANTGSHDWDEIGLVGGTFRVKLVARDAVGLQAVDASASDFGIWASVVADATLLSPNGGEAFGFGVVVPLIWTMSDTCTGSIDSTRVTVSLNGGGDWTYVATVLAPDTTAYWTAPSFEVDSALVQVEVYNAVGVRADQSDVFFSVVDDVPPTVTVLAPNGGEALTGGSAVSIEATLGDNVGIDSVCVAFTVNDGGAWSPIECGQLTFPYGWTVPDVNSDSCRVRIQVWDTGGNPAEDVSDTTFTIQPSVGIGDGMAAFTRPVLLQNHPNPMRGAAATTFSFYLPEESPVSLKVFDISGRLVRSVVAGSLPEGYHERPWNGTDDAGRSVGEGIYFYVMETRGHRDVRKLVKLR